MSLGEILNYQSSRPVPNVIWRKEWATKFISPWGIFERFKLANYATSKDIFVVFGTDEANTNVHKKIYLNLIDFKGLLHDKLMATFGPAIFDSTRILINQFILPLNQGSFNHCYMREQLSYCPECLKTGYHSIFHQFIFLDTCPMHEISLQFLCPECRRHMRYELSHDTRIKPFHCKCGAPLSGEIVSTNFLSLWSDANTKILNQNLSTWIGLDQSKLDQLSKLILLPSLDTKIKQGRGVLEVGLVSVGASNLAQREDAWGRVTSRILMKTRPVIPKTKWFDKRRYYLSNTIKKPNDLKINNIILDQIGFERYAYLCLYQFYKAIVRHIKNTQIKGHISCISSYVKRKHTFDACYYARAYIRLRQELECKSDPTEIDNSISKNTGFSGESPIPSFFSILYNPLLFRVLTSKPFKEIFGDLEKVNEKPEWWSAAIQILSRPFCHTIIQKYYDWLEIVKKDCSQTKVVGDLTYYPKIETSNPNMTIQLSLITLKLLIVKQQWINTKNSY